MNSVVKYLKVIGGSPGKEQILVGLHNGQVLFNFSFLILIKLNNSKCMIFIGFDVTC